MLDLVRYAKYSRKDVHDILSPDSKFTPQAGTWGMQGIVKVSKAKSDYVFFVTYGQSQGEHKFDEGIDENGILSWQSQPSMGFDDKYIKDLISHNPYVSKIYLFLRTRKNDPYTYLGLLEYVEHNLKKEYPVYFIWQIIDWNPEQTLSSVRNLVLDPPQNRLPISSNSFTWLTRNVLIKTVDMSDTKLSYTQVPLEVVDFWGDQLLIGQSKDIVVSSHSKLYGLKLLRKSPEQVNLFWEANFNKLLRSFVEDALMSSEDAKGTVDALIIRFERTDNNKYLVDLIDESKSDVVQIFAQKDKNLLGFSEGGKDESIVTRYERDPKNRKLAIEYHGLTCYGCDFNFADTYGPLGKDFIEIHHIKPLYKNDAEVIVNPKTDLIPLCSNCHSMVHRSRKKCLSLGELREAIRKKKIN